MIAAQSEFGEYGSRASLLAEAERSALFGDARTEEGWIRRHLAWELESEPDGLSSRRLDFAPLDLLAQRALEPNERARALEVAQSFDEGIRAHAHHAYVVLLDCVRDYTRNRMVRVPGHQQNALPPSTGSPSRYVSRTTIRAGDWTYHIDFQSRDYERLERALEELEHLREKRKEEVLRALTP